MDVWHSGRRTHKFTGQLKFGGSIQLGWIYRSHFSESPRNARVRSRTSCNRRRWRKQGTQRWFHASLSIAGVLILNGSCHSWKVGLTKCSSFLVIRKFLFDDPLSNFFHMHTGNGLEEVLENEVLEMKGGRRREETKKE